VGGKGTSFIRELNLEVGLYKVSLEAIKTLG
jgi:hypothetical protein